MISPTVLAPTLAEYLPRQRWFGAKDRTVELVRVVSTEVLRSGWPALLRVEAEVSMAGDDSGDDALYQLLIGLRPAGDACEFLAGHEHSSLGEFETDQGQATAYDGLLDSELALALLSVVGPEHPAERVRPMGVEQSNTSLVYDEQMILKVFRRLQSGPNPEVAVTEALAAGGFTHVAEPLAAWRHGHHDLGLLQRFLAGAIEGWAMALTSLRDLYADPTDPAEAGGDFGSESQRLGEVTADLHAALADAFGCGPGDVDAWAELMETQIHRVLSGGLADAALDLVARLRKVSEVVPAIRIHGDYHLGQVLRTDAGWYVLDFEGEPARPMSERQRPSSPLRDVAGMLRSFHYAPAVAMLTQEDDMTGLARAWELRNRDRFCHGYFRRAADGPILPADPAARSTVLAAFELDKAVYEVAYERAHRPDWAYIPEEAVRRLVSGGEHASGPHPGGIR
ncbi:MAG: maltokinase N-terminal cap-like domain-containing protein [Acidimicrobiia bacterium]